MVFLWRQYLELQLKSLIESARELYSGEIYPEGAEFPLHHDLQKLWCELRPALERYQPRSPEVPAADGVIQQFSKFDPGSYSFRYPFSKKGEDSLASVPELVNVECLHSVMLRLANFLDAAGSAFAHELQCKADFEQAIEDFGK
jgi:hypothetical protein